ncbi:hypothetical protein [Variovorax ginsengisoli]|uniref:Uncharacterized protein n=1 Tax=Variovorax ginsengisoli TaxID=363844 RepID=A0ABT9S8B5_9BURK|nr:hypothetical protein [Variovorax ginsengisoli]MDP9900596.1 hypothetical protein [Variovorax ginsengisoli]
MIRALRPSLIAAVLLAAGTLASAQSAPGHHAKAQRERAVCDGVQQDRAACLREAGAAQQEARRGGLTNAAPTTYEQNALARCRSQPAPDRADCEARITGKGAGRTFQEGSVMGGGVIRETVTPIPAPPAPRP